MRILTIGDIHGCTKALDTLLAEIAPRPDDLIVTLGDYVDRGPDSRGTIERLLALHRTHRVVSLRGNHDFMMAEARSDPGTEYEWLRCGGRETLASYSRRGELGSLDDVPAEHWEFLGGLRDWYETDTHFFVHANVYPDLPLPEQPAYMLHWEQLYGVRPHQSGKIMVCGHTAQRGGTPLNLGHAVCIDTWVYGKGWLTCLDVSTGLYWQANQAAQRRTGRLAEI